MFCEENCLGNVTAVKLGVNAVGIVFRNAHGGESQCELATKGTDTCPDDAFDLATERYAARPCIQCSSAPVPQQCPFYVYLFPSHLFFFFTSEVPSNWFFVTQIGPLSVIVHSLRGRFGS